MAGKVTVSIELTDGTKIEYRNVWSGDNPAFEGAEAQKAATFAIASCRLSIEATHGRLPVGAVFTPAGGK